MTADTADTADTAGCSHIHAGDGENVSRKLLLPATQPNREAAIPSLIHIVIALLREEKFHMKTMKSSNSLILLNIRILKFQCQNIEI